jgi:predicted Zn finger-like uncharacterized protein
MLTCCPACTTSFRVTPEQLKVRAGKVRCGKCQTVFNALDSLVELPPEVAAVPVATAVLPPVAPEILPTPAPTAAATAAASAAQPVEIEIVAPEVDILLEPPSPLLTTANPEAQEEPTPEEAPVEETATASGATTPEAVRDAAVAVGLVAARETTEIPGYNKWAEGAFTTPISVSVPTSHPVWPFVLVALLLILSFVGQVAHYYRAELAVTTPSLRPLLESACALLDCEIPLPRHVELISIEASDLQVDPAHGGALTLSATLKNRAAYAQAWPALEITLTDVQDNAVLRRVLQPAEYLPPKADPTLFPPSGEAAVRLWLETKEITAAGYRLYVFYP